MLLEQLESSLSEIVLRPSAGGVFEVSVDGELVSSKKSTGKHTELNEILAAVRANSKGPLS